jgi:hypothetical protein
MLSPVKAITAGALVFAIGGVMLVAQPFEQQVGLPGAATDMVPSTFAVQRAGEPVERPANVFSGPVESTDQRASGTLIQAVASAPIEVPDGDGGIIQRLAMRLVNDGAHGSVTIEGS